MTPLDDDTPRARLLRQRQTCELGIAQAEACLENEGLAPHWPGYRNRLAGWLDMRDAVDRALAALGEEEFV